MAQEDLASFCFERSTNLSEAENSLTFLLLPKEKVFMRPENHCFDVLTSTDRSKLLEKFLRKRYTLVSEGEKSFTETRDEHCQLEFKTTRDKKVDSKNIRLGSNNAVNVGSSSLKDVSVSQLYLGSGKQGLLDMEGKTLQVECTRGASGIYQLIFSYREVSRATLSTQVSLRPNEVLNVAQVVNDLNQKSKTIGLPQSSYQEAEGKETIKYELQIK